MGKHGVTVDSGVDGYKWAQDPPHADTLCAHECIKARRQDGNVEHLNLDSWPMNWRHCRASISSAHPLNSVPLARTYGAGLGRPAERRSFLVLSSAPPSGTGALEQGEI